MNYVARFILWFFAVYVAITVFGVFLFFGGNSAVGAIIGLGEYALFHIIIGNSDLRQYEPVARMFIYVVVFMKASIALTISAAITVVQYAESKRERINEKP